MIFFSLWTIKGLADQNNRWCKWGFLIKNIISSLIFFYWLINAVSAVGENRHGVRLRNSQVVADDPWML